MATEPGTNASRDPLECEIESALAAGRFIAWNENDAFVSGVSDVRDEIVALATNGSPRRALPLLESFVAGCHAKMDEVDDSSGFCANFAGELPIHWARARGTVGCDGADTVETLVNWSTADEYGIYGDVLTACVPALGEDGLDALEHVGRAQLDAAAEGTYGRTRAAAIIEAVLELRGDADAYEALATELGGPARRHCATLARMFLTASDAESALAWAERGLAPCAASETARNDVFDVVRHQLAALRREILARLGRSREATESAWHDYRENPGVQSLEELFRYVSDADRTSWHTHAMDTLHTAPLGAALRILTHEHESERLATVVEKADRRALVGISHTAIEPAAELLAAAHPHAAAQLRIAAALRIVEPGKSPYYAAAHRHLGHARELLLAAGHEKEWVDLVSAIRAAHRRKYSFMPRFEAIVAGRRPVQQPTFLDRARAAWQRRTDRPTGE